MALAVDTREAEAAAEEVAEADRVELREAVGAAGEADTEGDTEGVPPPGRGPVAVAEKDAEPLKDAVREPLPLMLTLLLPLAPASEAVGEGVRVALASTVAEARDAVGLPVGDAVSKATLAKRAEAQSRSLRAAAAARGLGIGRRWWWGV